MPKKSEKPKKSKTSTIQSPKGMRDIMDKEYYEYLGFFEKAAEISTYYGFKPIETPILEKIEVFTKTQGEGTDIIDKEMYSLKTKGGDQLVLRPEGTAGIMRAYIEHGMQSLPQPVMLYYSGPYFRHENPQRGRFREFRQFGVEIMGTQKSIADAIVIKTFMVILEEAGVKNLTVKINSIGDSECRPEYVRSLIAYYKKHINEICTHCRQRMKTNPLRLLDCKNSKCQEFKEDAPTPVAGLCTECRKHFKEVLEYLENLKIPYEITGHLVRGLDYYTKTVFEIFSVPNKEDLPTQEKDSDSKDTKKEQGSSAIPEPLALASGGRYDGLSKTLGSKKEISSVGGGIGVDRVVMIPNRKHLNPRIVKKPKVYFIQFGFEAKLKSLAIIDILRKSRLPVMQALSKDGLGAQLGQAEKLGIPYTIIFGQKEALDGTVIVRDMKTRSQEVVDIDKLCDYLKNLK